MRFHCTVNSNLKKAILAAILFLMIEVNMIVVYTYTMVDDSEGDKEEDAVTRVKRIDPTDIDTGLVGGNTEIELDTDSDHDAEPDSDHDVDSDPDSESDIDSNNNTNSTANSNSDSGSGDGVSETKAGGHHHDQQNPTLRPVTEAPLLPEGKNQVDGETPVTDSPAPSTPKPPARKEGQSKPSLQHAALPSPPIAEKDSKLPNAIVIGSAFSGSAMLLDIIKLHPQVLVTNNTHFFDHYALYSKGTSWYVDQLPEKKNGQVLIEEATSMFSIAGCPIRLKSVEPNMKLIVLLRNPLERSFMDYQTHQGNGVAITSQTFRRDIIDKNDRVNTTNPFIRRSLYDLHLATWFKSFNLSQFLFIDYSQLLSRPFATLSRVEKFLGVQKFFHKYNFVYNKDQMVCLNMKYFSNQSDSPKCLVDEVALPSDVTVSQTLEIRLRDFFAPHMEKTLKLLSGSLELEDMVSLVLT